jgi:hypothetical protein
MTKRNILQALSLPLLAVIASSAAACGSAGAPGDHASQAASELAAPTLGTVASFAVLGGSTVTNTGATTVNGDLGVSPGLAITGFPPGLVTGGTTHAGDAVALQAQTDVANAYDTLAAEACTVDLTGKDLGGLTLTPGVYCFSSSAQLTGALVLDAAGKADAVFIFKMASTLTTASNASVAMINGGSDCNVFWQVGSSATVGTGTVFVGSVLALASITLTTGAKVSGRALARTGAVTMDDNAVALPICAKAPASDAGVADAAPASDAGATDAAHADTGTDAGLDAGAPADAGSTDAGTADAATSDAGAGDAATN